MMDIRENKDIGTEKRVLMIDNFDSFTYNLVHYLEELGAEVIVRRNDAITIEEAKALEPSHIVISPGPGRPEEAGVSRDIVHAFQDQCPLLGVCLGQQCIGAVHGRKVIRGEKILHGKTSLIYHTGTGLFAGLKNPFLATRYHSLLVEAKPGEVPMPGMDGGAKAKFRPMATPGTEVTMETAGVEAARTTTEKTGGVMSSTISNTIESDEAKPGLRVLAWGMGAEDGTSSGEIMATAHTEYPLLHGVQFHPESIASEEGKQLLRNFLALKK